MTLTDTGPLVALVALVALVDKGEAAHSDCALLLPRLNSPLVSTWPCLTEAMYLLGKSGGYLFQRALWELYLSGLLVFHAQGPVEADRMQRLMENYRDIPMDFADASLVAAAETLGVQTIFTLDRHFYAYRKANGQAFSVVP